MECRRDWVFFLCSPEARVVQCRKGMKIAKDRITVMLCCNAAGTQKMDLLVIGTAKRPRCFSKNWDPSHANIIYEHNKTAWMDGKIFSSVEVKVMSLKEVREAAAAVLLFLEENRSSSQAAAREICAELSRMTVTARHVQPSVAELFRRAGGSVK